MPSAQREKKSTNNTSPTIAPASASNQYSVFIWLFFASQKLILFQTPLCVDLKCFKHLEQCSFSELLLLVPLNSVLFMRPKATASPPSWSNQHINCKRMQIHPSIHPSAPPLQSQNPSFPTHFFQQSLAGVSHLSRCPPVCSLDFPALFKDVQLPHQEPGWPPQRPVVSPSVAGSAWVEPCEVLAGISALIPAITLPEGVIRILLQITVKWTSFWLRTLTPTLKKIYIHCIYSFFRLFI